MRARPPQPSYALINQLFYCLHADKCKQSRHLNHMWKCNQSSRFKDFTLFLMETIYGVTGSKLPNFHNFCFKISLFRISFCWKIPKLGYYFFKGIVKSVYLGKWPDQLHKILTRIFGLSPFSKEENRRLDYSHGESLWNLCCQK